MIKVERWEIEAHKQEQEMKRLAPFDCYDCKHYHVIREIFYIGDQEFNDNVPFCRIYHGHCHKDCPYWEAENER